MNTKRNHYGFAQMQPGDSFLAPASQRSKIASAASKFRERHRGERRFSVRLEGRGMVRVRRVE